MNSRLKRLFLSIALLASQPIVATELSNTQVNRVVPASVRDPLTMG